MAGMPEPLSLRGALDTAWPDAFYLTTPGDIDGGTFSYHYGLDVGAQAAIHIEVAGQDYDWVGDIPYVPQIDFQVEADGVFDAWGFAPGVTLSSTTETVTLAQVGIGDIVGGSIPREYIKPIDEGIKEALTRGVLAGSIRWATAARSRA